MVIQLKFVFRLCVALVIRISTGADNIELLLIFAFSSFFPFNKNFKQRLPTTTTMKRNRASKVDTIPWDHRIAKMKRLCYVFFLRRRTISS